MDAVIIDYGGGNVQSVKNALQFLGKQCLLSSDPKVISRARRVILPCQGHFGALVKRLEQLALVSTIREAVGTKPFLGICVGMQILLERSDEAPGVPGFGFVQGRVRRFPRDLKHPQMGWNAVTPIRDNSWIPYGDYYFAHSYYCDVIESENILATTDYGLKYPSVIYQENLLGVQFHPEKSGEQGLQILNAFFEKIPC